MALVGCAQGQSAPTGTVAEIADKVFAASGVENFGMEQALQTEEDNEYFLGSKDYPAFSEAIAVMPMINLDTRVLVVIKAADKQVPLIGMLMIPKTMTYIAVCVLAYNALYKAPVEG